MTIDTITDAREMYEAQVYETLLRSLETAIDESTDFYEAYGLALEFGSLTSMFPESGHPDDGYIKKTIDSTRKFFVQALDPLVLRHRIASSTRKAVRINDGSVLVSRIVDKESFADGNLGLDPDYVLVAASRFGHPLTQWHVDPRFLIGQDSEIQFASLGSLMDNGTIVLDEPQTADYDLRFYSVPKK